jgi:hypothetical protein
MSFAAFVSKMGLNIEFSYLRDLPVNLHQYPQKHITDAVFSKIPNQMQRSISAARRVSEKWPFGVVAG